MLAQSVAATAVAKHGSYTLKLEQVSRQCGVRFERTEQLGRSATDWAPTSDAASRKCSRGKHFIVVRRIMA